MIQKDDVKQSQYVALATVYFISVLMVSRYRDIIESNNSINNANENSSENLTASNSPSSNITASEFKRIQNLNDSDTLNGNYLINQFNDLFSYPSKFLHTFLKLA